MKRLLRPCWLVIYVVIIYILYLLLNSSERLYFSQPLEIHEGDTLYALVGDMGMIKKYTFKKYLRSHDIDTNHLEIGHYDDIVGEMTYDEFFSRLDDGPSTDVIKLTLLEGWSSYDIDDYLSEKGLISPGEYREYVSNRDGVRNDFEKRGWYANGQWSSDYAFMNNVSLDRGLEGILYPDTYHVDSNYPVVEQLVRLQLQGFVSKVVPLLKASHIGWDGQKMFSPWGVSLSWYEVLILSSIVEKEERIDVNRKQIAGVFLNRLQNHMRIDADISLCYGLGKGYESCTPDVIVYHLYDKNNLYNTRVVSGLPPTPIVSPTAHSVDAVLHAEHHDYLFYLHDKQGHLHLSETVGNHNQAKEKYL